MRISINEKRIVMERILAVAEKQVSELGLSSVTLRTIAEEAGIKTGSLYNHFKSGIDEVFLLVNSRTIFLLDEVLANAARSSMSGDISDLFEKLAIAYLHFAIDNSNRFKALFEHQMKGGEPIPEWHVKDLYQLFRHVESPLKEIGGNIGEAERNVLARTVYSSVHGIVHLGLQGRMIALPVPVLEQQLKVMTRVLATGLTALATELS